MIMMMMMRIRIANGTIILMKLLI